MSIAEPRLGSLKTGAQSARTLTPISICCFGRGGSSMIWNLLGSSPDVLMADQEWHRAALRGMTPVRKLIRASYRASLVSPQGRAAIAAQRALSRPAAARFADSIEPGEHPLKPQARYVSTKLMDYHLFFLPMIEAGFAGVKPVIFIRDPLAQCESLMRSGLTLEESCRWYADVLHLMKWVRDGWAAPVTRFEDLIADPQRFALDLFETVGVSPPRDHRYRLKRKAFGASRQSDSDAVGEIDWHKGSELCNLISPDVNRASVERLSAAQREVILSQASDIARDFGYSY